MHALRQICLLLIHHKSLIMSLDQSSVRITAGIAHYAK